MTRVIIFTVIASIAHILPWKWRLWLPAAKEHVSLADSVNIAVANVLPFLAY